MHPDPMWSFNCPFYKTTYHHMSKWSQSGLCLLVQMEIKCQIVAQKELKTRCRIKEWEMSHSQTTNITFPSYFIVHKIAVIIKSKVKQSFHGNDCLKNKTCWPSALTDQGKTCLSTPSTSYWRIHSVHSCRGSKISMSGWCPSNKVNLQLKIWRLCLLVSSSNQSAADV